MVDPSLGYGEGRDPIPAIGEPTVMFMINRSLPERWDAIDVYRATQCGWVIGDHARARAVYALGVSHGVVRGAFRIDGWRHVGGTRWCFDGRTAHELGHVVGTSIERIKASQGASNPVRLHLAGIPAGHSDSQ